MMSGLNAPGVQTFGQKYVPFAAGFAHTPDEAAVYRSSRLHAVNPTAAVSDDVSYYWTLVRFAFDVLLLSWSLSTFGNHLLLLKMCFLRI